MEAGALTSAVEQWSVDFIGGSYTNRRSDSDGLSSVR